MSAANTSPNSSSAYDRLRHAPDTADASYLAAESERLETLKQALFAAYQNSPRVGIPVGLTELVATYTNALRLQLNLMGYRALPIRGRASIASAARSRQP